jgi:hypothetical protein
MARISRDVRFEARRDLFYSTPELETTPSIEENTLYQGTAFEYEGGFDGLFALAKKRCYQGGIYFP